MIRLWNPSQVSYKSRRAHLTRIYSLNYSSRSIAALHVSNMSPSNQTWRTTPPKACTPKVLRIISIPPRPTPIPYPQPPIEDKPFPPRRFNRFNSSANVPRRPDYFVSERHFYFQLLEEKMNSVPLPPLPPKIEYGETIPRPEWRPQTPPRTGRDEGIKLTRAYWLDRYILLSSHSYHSSQCMCVNIPPLTPHTQIRRLRLELERSEAHNMVRVREHECLLVGEIRGDTFGAGEVLVEESCR